MSNNTELMGFAISISARPVVDCPVIGRKGDRIQPGGERQASQYIRRGNSHKLHWRSLGDKYKGRENITDVDVMELAVPPLRSLDMRRGAKEGGQQEMLQRPKEVWSLDVESLEKTSQDEIL
ncbi:unnamed protein product [Calypogeia fissa]